MVQESPLPSEVNKLQDAKQVISSTQALATGGTTTKEVRDPTDTSGRYSIHRKKADRENHNIALPFCPESKLPSFIEHDRRVLLFTAYYDEDVHESAIIEEKRIHTCELYFYVEDGTMEIIESKQENSGIVQGRFLRRSKVAKPGGNSSSYYEIDDLKIGSQVVIYSRTFYIASCNESTKEFVITHHGWDAEDIESIPIPLDRFAETKAAESKDAKSDRRRKMNDLKQVMESMLGKETSMTDRGMFLENGTDALCFHVLWDDRDRLYGEIQYFRLLYYLADDTVEIVRDNAKNDGAKNDGPFLKLLKRSKLPKDGKVSDTDCYTWKDLAIGQTVNVLGRVMQVATCDAFTRQYYQSNGIILEKDMPLKLVDKKLEVKRVIPPYNGFGSEEDSLRSCTGSLSPPPPKKDLQKMRDKGGVVLRFNAQLVSTKADDAARRFVLSFFMEDDTIAIREPPVKNSGVMGGNFLSRQMMKQENGTYFAAKDMYVGNVLNIVGHQFLLLNADEFTYRLMEMDDTTFPFSDITRLYEILSSKQNEIKTYFVTHHEGTGMLNQDGLEKCLKSLGLKLNSQELLTIWRKLDKKGNGTVSFTKLIKLASDDSYEFSTQSGDGTPNKS